MRSAQSCCHQLLKKCRAMKIRSIGVLRSIGSTYLYLPFYLYFVIVRMPYLDLNRTCLSDLHCAATVGPTVNLLK